MSTYGPGKLGNIQDTTHRIDLILGAGQFKSAPYRPGLKARELEEIYINRQHKAGLIEQYNAE